MGFEPRRNPSDLETVNEFTKKMQSATEEAKSMIRKVQEDMMLMGIKGNLISRQG